VWWPHCSPVGPLTAVQPANTEPTTTWYYLPTGGVSRPRPSLTVASCGARCCAIGRSTVHCGQAVDLTPI
jgi:hypothetical protein